MMVSLDQSFLARNLLEFRGAGLIELCALSVEVVRRDDYIRDLPPLVVRFWVLHNQW